MSLNGTAVVLNDGEALVAMGVEARQVVWQFARPLEIIRWNPDNAKNFALEMGRKAYEAQFGREPSPQRNIVTEELRKRLRARAVLVVRSLTEAGRSPKFIAEHVTDLLLSEIG